MARPPRLALKTTAYGGSSEPRQLCPSVPSPLVNTPLRARWAGLLYPAATWLYWIGFFEVARGLFLLYHHARTAEIGLADAARTLLYGLRLDASLAAYFTLPVAVAVAVALSRQAPPPPRGRRWLRGYTWVLLALTGLLVVVDLELYAHWGFRIDTTLAQYLSSPTEMAASAGDAPVGWLTLLYLVLICAGGLLWERTLGRWPREARLADRPGRWRVAAQALLAGALLVLPLRGGWQQIPVNQSNVYFSQHAFANHAAVNAPWNLLYYALRGESARNPYEYLPTARAQAIVDSLYAPARHPAAPSPSILAVRRPHVLVVILESFTGKLVGFVPGGERGVTPALDSVAAAGLAFTNIYAAGNRSEKGLAAILSGYPAQPTTSLTRVPRKTERVAHLARRLRSAGYQSQYWYGGELTFANLRAYLLNAGYDRLIEKKDFPLASYNSKWGVHDHLLLARLADSLRRLPPPGRQPWLTTVFTLSSHEPYDVPGPAAFPGTAEANRFRSSIHYTDRCLGRFLRALRGTPAWDSTLVVLVADHGHPQPGATLVDDPRGFRIPLVLTGGALAPAWRGQQRPALGSQTDMLATVLTQLGLPTADLPWSRDLLVDVPVPWAFYAFTDGFGLLTPAGALTFDNISRRPMRRAAGVSSLQIRQGQALMQQSFADYLRL